MSKNNKRIEREKALLDSFEFSFKRMDELKINYDRRLCDSKHAFVVHAWIHEENKCSIFMKTLRWVPFGYHKGISGQGLMSLKEFLEKENPFPPKEEELTYREKLEAIKTSLLTIKDEKNFEVIDEIIKKYCS